MVEKNISNKKKPQKGSKKKHIKVLNCLYKAFVALGIVAIILLIIFKPCNCICC